MKMSKIVLDLKCANCGNEQKLNLPKGYYFFSIDNMCYFNNETVILEQGIFLLGKELIVINVELIG